MPLIFYARRLVAQSHSLLEFRLWFNFLERDSKRVFRYSFVNIKAIFMPLPESQKT
jgi:hypothetical protein